MTEFKLTLDLSERLEAVLNKLYSVMRAEVKPATVPDYKTATAPPMSDSAAAPQPTSAAVPVAEAPTFTVEQVGKAGADLIAANPGKMAELQALLAQFGAPCVTALKPEQLGPFATALRGLGANL